MSEVLSRYWFILVLIAGQKRVGGVENQRVSALESPKTVEMSLVPYLQVRSNCIMIYNVWEGERRHTGRILSGAYSGRMSDGSRRRVLKAIDLYLQRNPTRIIYNPVIDMHHLFRIGFVTLTVSDRKIRTHAETYPLLKEILRTARRKYGIKDYIWKAELQERGQVHYHLTIDQFWHWQDIRKEWNKLQRKAGFLDDFARREKHFNPNSIDVHSVVNIRDIGAYLAKYIAKEVTRTGTDAIDGKVWDCSAGLKGKRWSGVLQSQNENEIFRMLHNGEAELVELDRCSLIKLKNPSQVLTNSQKIDYQKFLNT